MAVPSDPNTVCAPWITADDLCGCDDAIVEDCETGDPTPLTYPFTDEELVEAASNILFARTCYQYPGVCTSTFHPCLECHHIDDPCSCGTYEVIPIHSTWPIVGVAEVKIDGVPLAPTAYRLDDFERIVRIDGENWPRTNSLALPDGNCSEVEVTYTYGIDPPIELRMAAVELACQLKRACEGKQCSLTERVGETVRTLSRRGVSITTESLQSMLQQGSMGNDIIDHAVAAYGCGHSAGIDVAKLRRQRGVRVDSGA